MERVAFIIEDTEMLLGCLLNPESLVIRRRAGIQPRQSVGGLVTGTELADDPLLFTNGGSTEIMLHLVFDVTLPGSSIETTDVRKLTRPLWDLAENNHQAGTHTGVYKRPPLCRLVWGKIWNIPGVITAVAERLEYFTPSGEPRRSWLSLAMQRVVVKASTSNEDAATKSKPSGTIAMREDVAGDHTTVEVGAASGERLDQLAQRYYGDVNLWRSLALHNNIDNPMDVSTGFRLKMPALLEH